MLLRPSDWVPNNPRFPVLLYRAALAPDLVDAAAMERLFAAHGWPPQWRNGVFAYHHYHATAHETLGVACGEAVLVLGGPGGRTVRLRGGDVVVLPAGTGHFQVEASADFLVVGAYPPGQRFDLCRAAPGAEERRSIAGLACPVSDPVAGTGGPLRRLWATAASGNDLAGRDGDG